jgi:dihydroorotate dehydrogenase (fumarate)
LGLPLSGPLVASASPLARSTDMVRRMEDAGAGAVVLFSLFEEQIAPQDGAARALRCFLDHGEYTLSPDEYLEHIERLKAAVRIPVIASLNGTQSGAWAEYAANIQQAGADALELNVYALPTDLDTSGGEIEEALIALVRRVRACISIPLAVKLGPFFSSIPNMSRRLVAAGAQGLVLFNRFSQPDIDIETGAPASLTLTTSDDQRLALGWIAILYGRLKCDFALTSGVHTAHDALRAIGAGASVAMLTSELLARGVGRIGQIQSEIRTWMEAHEYQSVAQIRGRLSQHAVVDPAALERANYVRALQSFS